MELRVVVILSSLLGMCQWATVLILVPIGAYLVLSECG